MHCVLICENTCLMVPEKQKTKLIGVDVIVNIIIDYHVIDIVVCTDIIHVYYK